MKINWKRVICHLLHTGDLRRWVKHLPDRKQRVLKCMKCDEEWEVDKRSIMHCRLEIDQPRLQDLYTAQESEFWYQVHEIDRLHKEGIL